MKNKILVVSNEKKKFIEILRETEKKMKQVSDFRIKPKHMICMYENDLSESPYN
jgi:hypothetical protein